MASRRVSVFQMDRNGILHSLRLCLASCPSLSTSFEFRLGLIARASSGGYSTSVCMTSLPLGTIIEPLFWRVVSRGRSWRDFLGSSFSASDDELVDEGGLAPP